MVDVSYYHVSYHVLIFHTCIISYFSQQIPDSEGEEEDAVAPGGRRLVSILAQQIPVKSALSPGRDKSKNKRPQRVSFQVQVGVKYSRQNDRSFIVQMFVRRDSDII